MKNTFSFVKYSIGLLSVILAIVSIILLKVDMMPSTSLFSVPGFYFLIVLFIGLLLLLILEIKKKDSKKIDTDWKKLSITFGIKLVFIIISTIFSSIFYKELVNTFANLFGVPFSYFLIDNIYFVIMFFAFNSALLFSIFDAILYIAKVKGKELAILAIKEFALYLAINLLFNSIYLLCYFLFQVNIINSYPTLFIVNAVIVVIFEGIDFLKLIKK